VGGPSAEHGRHTDAWHVVQGVAMSAMLVGALTRPLAVAALVVCAVGPCWRVLSVERRTGNAAHVRLVVGAGARAAMLLSLL
jgi:hypothetical protein